MDPTDSASMTSTSRGSGSTATSGSTAPETDGLSWEECAALDTEEACEEMGCTWEQLPYLGTYENGMCMQEPPGSGYCFASSVVLGGDGTEAAYYQVLGPGRYRVMGWGWLICDLPGWELCRGPNEADYPSPDILAACSCPELYGPWNPCWSP